MFISKIYLYVKLKMYYSLLFCGDWMLFSCGLEEGKTSVSIARESKEPFLTCRFVCVIEWTEALADGEPPLNEFTAFITFGNAEYWLSESPYITLNRLNLGDSALPEAKLSLPVTLPVLFLALMAGVTDDVAS